MKQKQKGFTLIELIVVMAIIAILVLIAAPKFMGYTEKAKLTQVINDIKVSEKAAEQYYLQHDLWPRDQTATPYTLTQLNTWVDDFRNLSGETVTLESGDYYDVDWDKLKGFMEVPANNFKYIIQNPVGDIYYANELTPAGEQTKLAGEVSTTESTTEEIPIIVVETINISSSKTNLTLGETLQLSVNVLPENAEDKTVNWTSSDESIATINEFGLISSLKVGSVTITATAGNTTSTIIINISPIFTPNNFTYNGSISYYEAPETGRYKLEVWGAQGGFVGGKGGYSSGEVNLTKGETIYIVIGGQGQSIAAGASGIAVQYKSVIGGYNGGGAGYAYGRWTSSSNWRYSYAGSGGGATHISKTPNLLQSLSTSPSDIIIVAGGGGGGSSYIGNNAYGVQYNGYAGGGLVDQSGTSTQTSGFSFLVGQPGNQTTSAINGGGGGYYGGIKGQNIGAAGGSGYIGGVQNGVSLMGTETMPDPTGTTMIGKTNHGQAKITRLY